MYRAVVPKLSAEDLGISRGQKGGSQSRNDQCWRNSRASSVGWGDRLLERRARAGRLDSSAMRTVWTGRVLQADVSITFLYPVLEMEHRASGHHGFPRVPLTLLEARRGYSTH